jgi:hypothetical protein
MLPSDGISDRDGFFGYSGSRGIPISLDSARCARSETTVIGPRAFRFRLT